MIPAFGFFCLGSPLVIERVGQPVTKVINPLGNEITVSAVEESVVQEIDIEVEAISTPPRSVCAEEGPASLRDLNSSESQSLKEHTEICAEMCPANEPAIDSVPNDSIKDLKENKTLCAEELVMPKKVVDFDKTEEFYDVPNSSTLCAEEGPVPDSPIIQVEKSAWCPTFCEEEKFSLSCDQESAIIAEPKAQTPPSKKGWSKQNGKKKKNKKQKQKDFEMIETDDKEELKSLDYQVVNSEPISKNEDKEVEQAQPVVEPEIPEEKTEDIVEDDMEHVESSEIVLEEMKKEIKLQENSKKLKKIKTRSVKQNSPSGDDIIEIIKIDNIDSIEAPVEIQEIQTANIPAVCEAPSDMMEIISIDAAEQEKVISKLTECTVVQGNLRKKSKRYRKSQNLDSPDDPNEIAAPLEMPSQSGSWSSITKRRNSLKRSDSETKLEPLLEIGDADDNKENFNVESEICLPASKKDISLLPMLQEKVENTKPSVDVVCENILEVADQPIDEFLEKKNDIIQDILVVNCGTPENLSTKVEAMDIEMDDNNTPREQSVEKNTVVSGGTVEVTNTGNKKSNRWKKKKRR